MKYPLAPKGVFWSLQGEGHLRGFQMCFLRLAGCSVGCVECDTDYSVASKHSAEDLATLCDEATPQGALDRWVWITGGEPADHDLRPLIAALRAKRFSVAVATSGHKRVIPPVDWLSVSPHNPDKVMQVYGSELKLVDGLGGLSLEDCLKRLPWRGAMYRYVQPLWDVANDCEDDTSLQRCLEFLKAHPDWSLSRQDHKHWGVA